MTVNITRLGPGVLTFGETGSLSTWSSQVTKCSVVPQVKTDDPVPVLSGESAPGDRTEAFSIKGTLLQDLGATASISEWTWTHRGETMPFKFVPNNAKGKAVLGECTIEATEIGGEVSASATADFEFACTSAPSIGDSI